MKMNQKNVAIPVLLFCLAFLLPSCKKKVEPDPYAFLKGTWRYENGAECLFDATTKIAKLTKVPTDNGKFKFVVGEDCWRNVASVGTDKWEYSQIIRYSDGKTVEYAKTSASKQDENTLTTDVLGLGKGMLKRVP